MISRTLSFACVWFFHRNCSHDKIKLNLAERERKIHTYSLMSYGQLAEEGKKQNKFVRTTLCDEVCEREIAGKERNECIEHRWLSLRIYPFNVYETYKKSREKLQAATTTLVFSWWFIEIYVVFCYCFKSSLFNFLSISQFLGTMNNMRNPSVYNNELDNFRWKFDASSKSKQVID